MTLIAEYLFSDLAKEWMKENGEQSGNQAEKISEILLLRSESPKTFLSESATRS